MPNRIEQGGVMPVLAIDGGKPVRARPFPAWPVYGRSERRRLMQVLRSRKWGTLGPQTKVFEAGFAAYLGTGHCLTVANGTVAIEIMLRALDIGPGDEVILPPYTFIATATAILMVGATPVFADIDPRSNTIDPRAVAAAVTPRTRAIIPVHIAGIPADMDVLNEIARINKVPILEDAAQAHGSEWKGAKLGTLGAAGSFSFQLSKNMSAGEGGALVTNDADLAERMWSIHHVGRRKDGPWYGHYELSSNYRLTDWQAAVLLSQLERLDGQIKQREQTAAQLNHRLSKIPGISVFDRDPRATRITHHLYMFRFHGEEFGGVPKSRFVRALAAEGIPCSEGYVEIQKQPLFSHPSVTRIVPDVDFASLPLPAAERACRETVWISQNALLDGERGVEDIVRAVAKVCEHLHESPHRPEPAQEKA